MTNRWQLWVGCASLVVSLGCDANPAIDDDGGAGATDGAPMDATSPAVLDGGAPPGDDGGEPDGGGTPPEDGRWGEPETTFTLPAVDDGDGLYIPDVQDRHPEVDWASLDRLYIPAGHYPFIRIGNLPDRDPADPLVITNIGGQVRVGGLDHHYLFSVLGGSGWVLTGRYDPVSQTGDAAFPGHRGGAYASSAGTYGILIDDDFVRDGNSGLAVGGGATRFEIELIEVREVGFAGMTIKTDDDGSAVMEDVRIHDNYIHDTGSEGFYIGSTQSQPQHPIRGLEVDHNRVLRTGTEAIQIGQITGDSEIHHNVFGPAAIDWRAAFQRYQDGNFQVSVRAGVTEIHHNILIGAAGSMFPMFGNDVDGDPRDAGDRVWVHDNYLSDFRNLLSYANTRGLAPMTFRFERNAIRAHSFDYDEVYDETDADHLIRVGTADTPVELVDNRFDDDERLCSRLPDEGNGEDGATSGSGNVRAEVPPVQFRDSGLPDGFDYLRLEMWTDVASLGGDAPVSYQRDDIVMHLGEAYRCRVDVCAPGDTPPDHPGSWEPLAPMADDVRLAPGSPHEGIGLDG